MKMYFSSQSCYFSGGPVIPSLAAFFLHFFFCLEVVVVVVVVVLVLVLFSVFVPEQRTKC